MIHKKLLVYYVEHKIKVANKNNTTLYLYNIHTKK